MTTLVCSPPLPIGGMSARITATGVATGVNFVRLSVTAAPEGSELRKRLAASKKERVQVHEGSLAEPYALTIDKGGVYHFIVEEFTRGGSATGGGHEGSTGSNQSLEKIAESSQTLHVGERCDVRLGITPDSATLSVFVFDETIRATTLSVHGIETPGIFNPTSQIAINAAAHTDLPAALAALVDITATSAIGSLLTYVNALIVDYAGHLGNITAHNSADTYNTVDAGFSGASSEALGDVINTIRRKLEAHMGDTDGSGTSAGYHDAHDNRNRFSRAGGAGDAISSWAALVDLRRVFTAHLGTASGVHNSADVTNVPSETLPPIGEVIRIFLYALLSSAPPVPQTVNTGAAQLRQLMSATTP